jgi:hypothetical protein
MPKILNPNEFIILQHRELNNKAPNLDKLAEYVYSLGKHTNGRTPLLTIEGDLIGHEGQLYFAHFNIFTKFNVDKFNELRNHGLASHVEETLDYIKNNRPETILNVELKQVNNTDMQLFVKMLRERNLDNYLYDSFNGKLLDIAREEDPNAIISHHALGYWSDKVKLMGRETIVKPTVYTIPHPSTFGDPKMPMIYGMVNSEKKFAKTADKENVYGASARFGDSNIFKIIAKSFEH